MESLKPVVARYLEINKQLDELNGRAKQLRDQRKVIEMDLEAAYRHPRQGDDELPKHIALNSSKLVFTVKAPGEWKKSWSLSKKQLEAYVMEILPEHGEDLLREIQRRHEPTLRGDDYQFDLKPMSRRDQA
jgi:hypothetical protein